MSTIGRTPPPASEPPRPAAPRAGQPADVHAPAGPSSPAAAPVDPAADPHAFEAALLPRLRAGESAAFETLLRVYGPRLLAVARRMMPGEHEAEDALQDAFLSAFKNLARFDGQSLLSTWLHRIVVNACLMRLRTKRRRPETSIEALLPAFLPDGHRRDPGPAWKPLPESGIELTEVRRRVRKAIDDLPDGYREVVLLRDIEGLDTQQAGEVLGLTPAAVKTRLHRARLALRELLDADLAQSKARPHTPAHPRPTDGHAT